MNRAIFLRDAYVKLLLQRRGGCWLALFAMALQLSFAFGHIHKSQHHVDGKLLLAVKLMFAQAYPRHSRHDENNDQKEKNSQICRTLNAAGSLVLPVTASVSGPFLHVETHRFFNNRANVSAIVFLPYQVRAPPFASYV